MSQDFPLTVYFYGGNVGYVTAKVLRSGFGSKVGKGLHQIEQINRNLIKTLSRQRCELVRVCTQEERECNKLNSPAACLSRRWGPLPSNLSFKGSRMRSLAVWKLSSHQTNQEKDNELSWCDCSAQGFLRWRVWRCRHQCSNYLMRMSSLDCQSFLFCCLIRACWHSFVPGAGGEVNYRWLPNTPVSCEGGRCNRWRNGEEKCICWARPGDKTARKERGNYLQYPLHQGCSKCLNWGPDPKRPTGP